MWCWIFFFNDTATTEIYTLSLHDALPIWTRALRGTRARRPNHRRRRRWPEGCGRGHAAWPLGRHRHEVASRSEEHTSELQSRQYLVCRLLLEKKKNMQQTA